MTGALSPRAGLPPRYGFGTSGLGNLGRRLSEADAQAVMASAWEAGFRYFDTSPLYGYGLSELRVGHFLRDRPRADYVISTKVGRYLVPPRGQQYDRGLWTPPSELMPLLDYSYDGTMRSLEQSHSRLGLARIDIALVHDIDRSTHGDTFARRREEIVEGAYRALDELRRSGHIGALGIGVNDADVATALTRDLDLDVVMLAGRYTLLDQVAATEFFPAARARGTKVVAVGVFNSGILASGAVEGATFHYAPALPPVMDRVRQIETVCSRHHTRLAAVAAQFPLAEPAVDSVVIGAMTPDQVATTAADLAAPIPAALWADLKAEGLLPATIAVP